MMKFITIASLFFASLMINSTVVQASQDQQGGSIQFNSMQDGRILITRIVPDNRRDFNRNLKLIFNESSIPIYLELKLPSEFKIHLFSFNSSQYDREEISRQLKEQVIVFFLPQIINEISSYHFDTSEYQHNISETEESIEQYARELADEMSDSIVPYETDCIFGNIFKDDSY